MSQHQDPVVIVSAARTPMGAFMGDFADLAAHDLGGAAIKAAVERAGIAPALVEEVLFGNCLMAGQGQAPARQALSKGGLPQSTGAVTLSKMCGAGMEATILAHDQLIAGSRVLNYENETMKKSGVIVPYLGQVMGCRWTTAPSVRRTIGRSWTVTSKPSIWVSRSSMSRAKKSMTPNARASSAVAARASSMADSAQATAFSPRRAASARAWASTLTWPCWM